MKTSHKDRINELISALKLSKNKFAKAIGTSSAVISKVTTQDINYGVELAEKIISTFPSVSPAWLLAGVGEMMLPENAPPTHPQNTPPTKPPASASPNADGESATPNTQHPKNKLFNNGGVSTGPEDFLAAHQEARQKTYSGAVNDAEQREWQRIDSRLRAVVSNLLHIQEVTEDVLGVPFDNEAYLALRRESAQPRIQRMDDGQYINPLNEMSYEEKSRFYTTRAQLLEQCEAELSEAIRNLSIALNTSNTTLFSSTPFKGSVAEFLTSSGFLSKRRRARYGNE